MRQPSDMAKRLAARYIKSQEDPSAAPPAPEPTAAIPQSKPGKDMLKKQIDALMSAFESGDSGAFDKSLDALNRHKSMLRS